MTLKEKGCVPEPLVNFRKYLQKLDKEDEDEDDDVDSGEAARLGTSELNLQFILDLNAKVEAKTLATKYFPNGGSSRLAITSGKLKRELAELLPKNDSETGDKLTKAKEDVLDNLTSQHRSWIAELYSKGILVDRSNETFFTGWLVDENLK